jgi:TolA-binding protein
MMKNLFLFLLFLMVLSYLHAEPSVYGPDTNSPSMKSQKLMQQNISTLQQRLIEQEESMEGLRSVIEGLSASVHALETNSNTIGTDKNTENASYLKLEAMIETMQEEMKRDYVRKVSVNTGLIEVKEIPSETSNFLTKSDKELFSEGVRLYLNKRYTDAKKHFVVTDNKGYKVATSNYYLGEISYYTKKYKDAIFFFKKSAGLNDKTTYIDMLLLHTAVSLEKSGEKTQAKAFYENIVVNYSGKRSAIIAKQRLEKL